MNYTNCFDISRELYSHIAVYPGNKEFHLDEMKRMPHDVSNLSAFSMGLHTGTHVDSPYHFDPSGQTIDKMKLEKFMGECQVIDLSSLKEGLITADDLQRIVISDRSIILFKTRNSFASTEIFDENFCGVSESAAQYLVSKNIKTVGIDGPSIDKFHSGNHPAHHVFFDAGVTIFEGLYLKDIAPGNYYFIGVPLKIRNAEASPVRAVLFS